MYYYMEPNLIDYYNEMPQMVHIIDNMNQELTEVQKKYEELQKKYKELKDKEKKKLNFQIYFTSIEERNEKHKQMMDNIKRVCDELIEGCMEGILYDYGLNGIGQELFTCILGELNKLTNDNDWSYSTTVYIVEGFAFFKGREMPHWDKIYNVLSRNDIKEILFDYMDDTFYEKVYSCYVYPGSDDY